MSCQLKVIANVLDVPLIQKKLFPDKNTEINKDNTGNNYIDDPIFSSKEKKLEKWDSKDENVSTKYSIIHEAMPLIEPGSSHGGPEWTCVLSGTLLISQLFNEDPVVQIKSLTYSPAIYYGDIEKHEEIVILYPQTMVTIDGFSLYQTLKACKNQAARAAASGNVNMADMPLLAYKKWGLHELEAANDVTVCGRCGWLGLSSGTEVKDKKNPKFEPEVPLNPRHGLYDKRRHGVTISPSPDYKMAATTDSFGRVILLDVPSGVAIRIWKGYRDAQVGWIESTEILTATKKSNFNKTSNNNNNNNEEEFKEQQHFYHDPFKKGRVPRRTMFLVIYAPRRGILETNKQTCIHSDKNSRKSRETHLMKQLNLLLKEHHGSSDPLLPVLTHLIKDIKSFDVKQEALGRILSYKAMTSSNVRELYANVINNVIVPPAPPPLPPTMDQIEHPTAKNFKHHLRFIISMLNVYDSVTMYNNRTGGNKDETLLTVFNLDQSEAREATQVIRRRLVVQSRISLSKSSANQKSVSFKEAELYPFSDFISCFELVKRSNKMAAVTSLVEALKDENDKKTKKHGGDVADDDTYGDNEDGDGGDVVRGKQLYSGNGGGGSKDLEKRRNSDDDEKKMTLGDKTGDGDDNKVDGDDDADYVVCLKSHLNEGKLFNLGQFLFSNALSNNSSTKELVKLLLSPLSLTSSSTSSPFPQQQQQLSSLSSSMSSLAFAADDILKCLLTYLTSNDVTLTSLSPASASAITSKTQMKSMFIGNIKRLFTFVASVFQQVQASTNQARDCMLTDKMWEDIVNVCSQSENIFSSYIFILIGRSLASKYEEPTGVTQDWVDITLATEKWQRVSKQFQDLLLLETLFKYTHAKSSSSSSSSHAPLPPSSSTSSSSTHAPPSTSNNTTSSSSSSSRAKREKRNDVSNDGGGGLDRGGVALSGCASGGSVGSAAVPEVVTVSLKKIQNGGRAMLPELIGKWLSRTYMPAAVLQNVDKYGRPLLPILPGSSSLCGIGLSVMMWQMFIVKRLTSAVMLTEKVGKAPKDRLIRKSSHPGYDLDDPHDDDGFVANSALDDITTPHLKQKERRNAAMIIKITHCEDVWQEYILPNSSSGSTITTTTSAGLMSTLFSKMELSYLGSSFVKSGASFTGYSSGLTGYSYSKTAPGNMGFAYSSLSSNKKGFAHPVTTSGETGGFTYLDAASAKKGFVHPSASQDEPDETELEDSDSPIGTLRNATFGAISGKLGSSTSLVELALAGGGVYDEAMVKHHECLCLIMKAVLKLGLKSGRTNCFKPLTHEYPLPFDVHDETVMACRLEFIDRLISSSISTLGDSGVDPSLKCCPRTYRTTVLKKKPDPKLKQYQEWPDAIRKLCHFLMCDTDYVYWRQAEDKDELIKRLFFISAYRFKPALFCKDKMLHLNRLSMCSVTLKNWLERIDSTFHVATVPLAFTRELLTYVMQHLPADGMEYRLSEEMMKLCGDYSR
ncbi:hypothetical protein HELRODRAFT_174556 [Helobdella robusta]|uniref:Rab3-GAP regulatory subunit N-terminal domain-containing protein n=1 Tax=Helobdella robusta TaxID=6412 RepID=T1F892_HELRO|nr:hypothetical protein HELRODRAFT_174556 [Helobdella robusta]ESO01598.1 hypothetical protein HELRODRAFT_174556 [Helobdella robusta]